MLPTKTRQGNCVFLPIRIRIKFVNVFLYGLDIENESILNKRDREAEERRFNRISMRQQELVAKFGEYDVIADNTIQIEHLLEGATKLSDKIELQYGG